jgi:two-component system chemotaxis response regulator CheY
VQALVIDDSAVTRGIMKQILERIGFVTFEAGNGREGLDRLRDLGKIDLVLVDWNMPEMDGIEFLQTLRTQTTFGALPVVMVSTNSEAENIAKSLAAGASEYVMKPFTEEIIRTKLEMLGFFQQ